MRSPLLIGLLLVLAGSASRVFAGEEDPEPVSVKALFANATHSRLQLSPDGTRIAALLSNGDIQHVAVRHPGGTSFDPLVRIADPDARLSWVAWANDERLLLSATQRHPLAKDPLRGMVARMSVLYGIGLEDRTLRELNGGGGLMSRLAQSQDQILSRLPEDRLHVLVAFMPIHLQRPAVGRLDVASGAVEVVEQSAHGIVTWHVDGAGNVRAGESYRDKRYGLWARVQPRGELVRLANRDAIDEAGIRFAGFHEDPGKLYVLDDHEGRRALFELDIATKERGALVFAHPEVDVGAIVYSVGAERRPIGVRFTHDRSEVHYFDAAAAREHAALARALERELGRPVRHSVASATDDGTQQLLYVSSDTLPPVYFYFNRSERRLTRLLDERPAVPLARLSPTKRVTYQARDGLSIPAYLTLPVAGPAAHLPLIVMPHGGPWARDEIRWDPEVQLFASRGFAVLQMNFRGSTGFGSKHLEAGFREWGQKIQDDISDGVAWAIAQGIADADRVGIYGASFGGYATLIGLAKTPNLYRAGAAYAPVTDIQRMLGDDRFYRWYRDAHEAWIGGGPGGTDELRANSPLRRAGEIRGPVLLGHGEHDQRVHVDHSRRMARALRKAGAPVEYLEFDHEIHGFLLEANRIRWYEALIAFFEKHLAPRATAGEAAARS